MFVLRSSQSMGLCSSASGWFRTCNRPTQLLNCSCRSYQSNPTSNPNRHKEDAQQLVREKYEQKIQKKLKEKGLLSLEDLKKANQDKIEADRIQQRKLYDELILKARQKINASRLTTNDSQTNQGKKDLLTSNSKKYSSPIKPLDSIIDVNKLASESSSDITKLWTAYHLSTSNPPRLGAVIPTQTYQEMIQFARKYPSFVIPLAKSSLKSSESSNPIDLPFEMQYLQWDFINLPKESNLPEFLKPKPTITKSTVPPTIVMYTPLAEFKLRQSFSQPTLILTHYTDLSDSHGIVLMRGDITPSSDGSQGGGKMTTTDAQLLILRLQQFYCPSMSTHQDSLINEKRKLLLQLFHEKPDQFELTELLNLVKDL